MSFTGVISSIKDEIKLMIRDIYMFEFKMNKYVINIEKKHARNPSKVLWLNILILPKCAPMIDAFLDYKTVSYD